MPATQLSPMQIDARRLLKAKSNPQKLQSGSQIMRPNGATTLLDGRRGESVKNQTLLAG